MERFGLDAVPAMLRTSRWYDYFLLQFAFSFNAGNFLLPALAVLGGHLPFFWAISSIVLGNIIAFLMISTFAIPGVDYGIPGQYAIRSVLGVGGSRYFSSPLRSLVSIYWFAVQSLGAAVVIQSMLVGLGVLSISAIPIAIVFAIIMTFIAIIGYAAVTRVIKWMMPLMIVIMAVMFVLFLTTDAPSFQWSEMMSFHGEKRWLVFFFYSSLSFAQYIAAISGAADICRYSQTRKDAFYGVLSGNALGIIVTACLAVYAAIAIGEWNPYVAATQLTDSPWLHLFILSGVVISMFAINLNNAYTGGFSLLNTFPKLSRIQATAGIGMIATALCLFPVIIDHAEIFISFLGSFASPLGGVIIADYVFVKKMKIDTNALQATDGAYHYFHGCNVPACCSIVIGFIYFHLAPDAWAPGLTSCILTGILYYVSTIIPKHSNAEKGI